MALQAWVQFPPSELVIIMNVEKRISRKELLKKLDEISAKIQEDTELKKRSEEFQKKYGTLTSEDLQRRFTI